MVFKRLQDSQDGLYLQAMQLYQTSFPLHEQRKPDAQRAILQEPDYQFNLLRTALRQPGAGAAWAKRKAGHFGDRPTHRRHLPAQERLL